jgi:membrane-bound serine protease (ClpP class)
MRIGIIQYTLLAAVLLPACLVGGETVSVEAAPAAAETGVAKGSLNPEKRGLALPGRAKIMVIPINDAETTKYGMIDEWQANFIARRLRSAQDEKFDLVVLEIDTNGGLVDACEEINKTIAACPIPVVAYVKGKAFSGGALISLGCKAIVMAPGSQIGGAKAISIFGDLSPDMKQKADSMMRATVTGLCDANKYPLPIALGMVDSAAEVFETHDLQRRFVTGDQLNDLKVKPEILRRWKGKDQILTLSAKEAVDVGLAAGLAADEEELFTGLNLTPAAVERADVTATEKAARFASNPLWRILLVLVGLVALIWELKSPGHGMGYFTFAFCIGVFFWLQIFSNNAGILELVMFGLGAVLLAVELFVLSGFGFPGFIGFALILLSIVMAFLPDNVSFSSVWKKGQGGATEFEIARFTEGAKWAAVTLVMIVAAAVIGLLKGAKLPGLSRMALKSEVSSTFNTAEVPVPVVMAPPDHREDLTGRTGVAETVLRPSGKVRLDDATYDATSEGAFIEAGSKVLVLKTSGACLIVRQTDKV